MYPQDRKYFRFRFSRVLALAFLLSSPPQAVSVPDSCAEVETALMTSPTAPLVEDPKFVSNVVECLTKEENWKAIKNVVELIQKLPELIDKAILVGKKGGLVVLSAYLLYRSFELYERAIHLARDCKMDMLEFELLQEEIEPLRDLEKELIPQWKNGNYINMQISTGELLEKLSHFSTVLRKLVQVIHQDAKKGESDKIWSVFYSVGAVAVCAGSFYTGKPVIIIIACGLSGVTIAISVKSSYSLSDTLTKLDMLWEDTAKMLKEIVKFRSQIAKMRGEFEV